MTWSARVTGELKSGQTSFFLGLTTEHSLGAQRHYASLQKKLHNHFIKFLFTSLFTRFYYKYIKSNISERLIYLKGKISRVGRGQLSQCSQQPTPGKAEPKSLTFHLGPPPEWQGPKHLSIFHCFLGYISRELSWQWTIQDLNWHPYEMLVLEVVT